MRNLERELENAIANVRSLTLTNETLNTALEAKVGRAVARGRCTYAASVHAQP